MTDKVQHVAQAIRDNIQAALPDGISLDYDYAARAAIEAMREPTKAMVAASNLHPAEQEIAIFAWQAMIDAALSPDKQ
jgi:hypothetical protein